MAKLLKPSVLLYGSLVVLLLVATIFWWIASRAFTTPEGASVATIRGMRATSIYATIESQGFKREKGHVSNIVAYKKGRHLVEVVENNGGVSLVKVTIRPLFRTDDVAFAPDDSILYSLVGMTPYELAKASINQSWACANFHKSAKRDDGVATFETRASDNIRFLIIKPSAHRFDFLTSTRSR